MLKVDQKTLDEMERKHEGIVKSIMRHENADLPACPHCKSRDTADVLCGIIGRTIEMASATTKVTLVANSPPGRYRCNACRKYFGTPHTGGFTLPLHATTPMEIAKALKKLVAERARHVDSKNARRGAASQEPVGDRTAQRAKRRGPRA